MALLGGTHSDREPPARGLSEARVAVSGRGPALAGGACHGDRRSRRRPRPGDRIRALLGLAILSSLAAIGPGPTPASGLTREYDLKAAFLFNFAQFVQWPTDAFPEAATPLTIGVLGNDPFGKSLDEIVANETVQGHRLVVRRCRDQKEIAGCHILFIGSPEAASLESLLARLEGRPVLTVGETADFAVRQGMIQFDVVESRVRLKVNVGAAKRARLTISSKLLRQADIVGTGAKR